MITQRRVPYILVLAVGAIGMTSFVTEAQARQVYCYASAMDQSDDKVSRTLNSPEKFYVTPIFDSGEDTYLLMAELGEAVPGTGLATCVTDEDDPDLSTPVLRPGFETSG